MEGEGDGSLCLPAKSMKERGRDPHHTVVTGLFYQHGVFCASYPFHILAVTVVAIVGLSWPVFVHVFKASTSPAFDPFEPTPFWEAPSRRSGLQETRFVERFGSAPHLRVEQIVFNSSATGVDDVLSKRVLVDVLRIQNALALARIPLASVVMNVPIVAANADLEVSLADICFVPANSSECLLHSPLDFWRSDPGLLANDHDVLVTLSNTTATSSFGTPIPLNSVLGGVEFDTSTSTQPALIHSAQSIIVSYFLEEARIGAVLAKDSGSMMDDAHIPPQSPIMEESLTSKIWDALWQKALDDVNSASESTSLASTYSESDVPPHHWVGWRAFVEVKNLYYVFGGKVGTGVSVEYVVVALSYVIVFFYISLVLGRVELVKSKFGLGMGAVIMVFSSLTMSVGLTAMMGVTSSLVPWEVLPFLIIAIGVENIFVMTNAVVTTSLDLPVKERVGMGLAKVGVNMLLSLGSQLFILLLVSMVDVPALQEFCLFACVAVVIDFMMQITFFATILSIDIRRLELSDLHKLNQIRSKKTLSRLELPEQSLGMLDSSSKRWSAIVMIIIMALIGFGLFGSTSSKGATVYAKSVSWEQSVAVTSDLLWDIINPTKADRYIEIRPPVIMTLLDIQNVTVVSPVFQRPPTSKTKWTITIDSFSFEISRSVFIIVFVGLLILASSGCVLISSIILHILKPQAVDDSLDEAKAASAGHSRDLSSSSRVISLLGSKVADVEFLDATADGTVTWSCGDGWIHLWNCRTSRKVIVPDDSSDKLPNTGLRDGITCLRLVDSFIFSGSYSGLVRVWDTYSGRVLAVLVNESSRGPVVAVEVGHDSVGPGVFAAARMDGRLDWWPLGDIAAQASTAIGAQATTRIQCQRSTLVSQSGISCLVVEPVADISLCANAEGHVAQVTNKNQALDVVLKSSVNISAIAADAEFDVLVTGSEYGDIVIQQHSSKKELLFIRSKDISAERDTRHSFESDSSKASYTVNGKKVSRLGSILEGHAGQITFLKIVRKAPNSEAPSATPYQPESMTFFLVSAAVDEAVNVWEISVSKQRSSTSLSVVSSTHVRYIPQPGCTTAACFQSYIIGAKRVIGSSAFGTSADDSDKPPFLRNRKGGRDPSRTFSEGDPGCWEAWILDLESIATAENESDMLSTLVLGPDNLAGIPVGLLASDFQSRKAARHSRFVAFNDHELHEKNTLTAWSDQQMSSQENDWIDDDSTEDAYPDSEQDEPQAYETNTEDSSFLLPVFGIHCIVATRWGIVCGFGNYVKIVLLDLAKSRK